MNAQVGALRGRAMPCGGAGSLWLRARYGGDGERGVHNGGTEPTGDERRRGCGSTRPVGRDAGRGPASEWRGVATGASGPQPPPTCARRAPRHSTALRAVTPAAAASSPFRLRSLRFSVVSSVVFATSCSRPPHRSRVKDHTRSSGYLCAVLESRKRKVFCFWESQMRLRLQRRVRGWRSRAVVTDYRLRTVSNPRVCPSAEPNHG